MKKQSPKQSAKQNAKRPAPVGNGETDFNGDWFYNQSSARLKDGKATKEDVFYLWLHTNTAREFLSLYDCSDDVAMLYGWLESVRDYFSGDGVKTGGDFESALAVLCFDVVGALAKGDSDLMSRVGMLRGLESIYNVGGWTRGDYIGVAFPIALRCMKVGTAALRNFNPSRHGEISRLIGELDKFKFHKQVKVADSVAMMADFVECEISRLESFAVSDGVKLYRAAAFLNVVYRDIGNTIIYWLKVADIGDNFALSKIRETVTGDESEREKFISPFTYNERLDCVEFVGSGLYGDLLDVARFESSRNGAANDRNATAINRKPDAAQGAANPSGGAGVMNLYGDMIINTAKPIQVNAPEPAKQKPAGNVRGLSQAKFAALLIHYGGKCHGAPYTARAVKIWDRETDKRPTAGGLKYTPELRRDIMGARIWAKRFNEENENAYKARKARI